MPTALERVDEEVMGYVRRRIDEKYPGVTLRSLSRQIGWDADDLSSWLSQKFPRLGKLAEVAPLIGHDLPSLITEVYRTLLD